MELIQFLANGANSICGETAIPIWRFLGAVVGALQIAIPVIIVLLATIDLGKAVMAGEDKKIKEAQGMLIKRLIYGVAIFFVVAIVQVVFGLVDDADTSKACFTCIANRGKC